MRFVSGSLRFQPVHDVAVRKRRQAVELDVAVAVRAADEVVAAAGGIHQSARRELQRIGHVAAWVRKVFKRRRVQRGSGVRVRRIHQRGLAGDRDEPSGGGQFQGEVDRLSLTQAGEMAALVCGCESIRLDADRVESRLQLREIEAAGAVCFGAALRSGLAPGDGYRCARDGASGRI